MQGLLTGGGHRARCYPEKRFCLRILAGLVLASVGAGMGRVEGTGGWGRVAPTCARDGCRRLEGPGLSGLFSLKGVEGHGYLKCSERWRLEAFVLGLGEYGIPALRSVIREQRTRLEQDLTTVGRDILRQIEVLGRYGDKAKLYARSLPQDYRLVSAAADPIIAMPRAFGDLGTKLLNQRIKMIASQPDLLASSVPSLIRGFGQLGCPDRLLFLDLVSASGPFERPSLQGCVLRARAELTDYLLKRGGLRHEYRFEAAALGVRRQVEVLRTFALRARKLLGGRFQGRLGVEQRRHELLRYPRWIGSSMPSLLKGFNKLWADEKLALSDLVAGNGAFALPKYRTLVDFVREELVQYLRRVAPKHSPFQQAHFLRTYVRDAHAVLEQAQVGV